MAEWISEQTGALLGKMKGRMDAGEAGSPSGAVGQELLRYQKDKTKIKRTAFFYLNTLGV